MAASSKTASAPSETKLVKELADILDKTGLAELEYETDAVAIRLSRVTGVAPVVAAAPAVSVPATAAPTPNPAESAAVANPADRRLRALSRPTRPTAPAARTDRPMRPPRSPARPRLPWWVASFIGWLIQRLVVVAGSLLDCLIGSFIM